MTNIYGKTNTTTHAKRVSLVVLLATLVVLVIPASSAFAATQSVAAPGTWRTLTTSEVQVLSGYDHETFVDAADASSNPQNISGSSPGWTPDGATQTRTNSSNRSAVVLDLPKVDLSCSTDVQVSVTGTADQVSGPSPVNFAVASVVLNANSEPLIDLSSGESEVIGTETTPGVFDLTGTTPVNPDATAFGLKVMVSAYIGDTSTPNAWDIHDVSVSLTYDDEGGTCTSHVAPAVATQCDDSYLDTHIAAVDPTDLTALQNLTGDTIDNVPTDASAALGNQGYTYNPNQDEAATGIYYRTLEIDISPQSILLGAGAVQLQVQFEFDPVTNFASMNSFIFGGGASLTPWSVFQAHNGSPGLVQKMTTYLDSQQLNDPHIYIDVATVFNGPVQNTSLLKNVKVTVSHLDDVSVCGIQATRNSSTTPPAVVAGVSTLPVTGFPVSEFVFLSSALLVMGYVLLRFSHLRFLAPSTKK